jgi:hypothetical protein
MTKVETRKCTKCGKEKPTSEFYKHAAAKDGLYCHCKICHKLSVQKWLLFKKREAAESKKENIKKLVSEIQQKRCEKRGISSQVQINSVLREMAETQLVIDREKAVYDARVEPHLRHLISFQNMLKGFLKSSLDKIKHEAIDFEFGKIAWREGDFNISLNTALAKERLEKP